MFKVYYGITIIESISLESNKPYAIRFYKAEDPLLIGLQQSHGYTYAEARKIYKESYKKPFGLELLIGDEDGR